MRAVEDGFAPVGAALSGIRVIDFGQYVAAPLVAQLLADHGADVIRVDPPGGPRWCADANAILQRGKRSIVLDLKRSGDRAIARKLVVSADVVLENFRPGVLARLGLELSSCLRENPRLIACSVPGFASDDPRSSMFVREGVVGSAAGLYVPRELDPGAEPVYNTLPLASCFAAMIAANSIIAALIARHRSNGAGQRIEVSLFDACFELTRYYADRTPGAPYPRIRLGSAKAMALTQQYVCRDGRFVHLSWLEGRQLEAFAEALGLTAAWQQAGLLDHARVRRDRAYSEHLRGVLGEVFRTRGSAEWMALANPEADLAECLTTEEWLVANEQARAIRAVITLEDPEYGTTHQAGHAVSMSVTPPQARGPRHTLDADRTSILADLDSWSSEPPPSAIDHRASFTPQASALEGVRAVDLTQILAGPTACRILAEFGADVTLVLNPHARAGGDFHLSVNGGKRSILLDLKKPGAMDVFWSLVADADVISTNFSSEVGARLGVDEESVRARRPDVIYSHISAYGLDGPLREFRGHEQVGQAITGMETRWGRDVPTPLMQPHPVNDFGTGHLAAFGILLALFHRLRTGHGQVVGASLAQTATLLQTPFMISYPCRKADDLGGQARRGVGPLERLFKARDRWFFVAARSVADIDGVEGLEHLDEAQLESDLEARFACDTAEIWVERLMAQGVGAHVLNSPELAMQDAWARSHGVSREVHFPEAGAGTLVGPAARLSRTPMRPTDPPPPPGWHADAILQELGLGDRLTTLKASGAVVQSSREPDSPEPRSRYHRVGEGG